MTCGDHNFANTVTVEAYVRLVIHRRSYEYNNIDINRGGFNAPLESRLAETGEKNQPPPRRPPTADIVSIKDLAYNETDLSKYLVVRETADSVDLRPPYAGIIYLERNNDGGGGGDDGTAEMHRVPDVAYGLSYKRTTQ